MQLRQLWVHDFRSYHDAELSFAAGLTAVVGDNGEGKTNLLEAIGYLATLGSLRGAPTEALIREGTQGAVVRAEGERDGRTLLIEAEINRSGRHRVQVNRQRLQRARDLLGALRVSVFAPDDLILVKGGPSERRRYLDDTLVAAAPKYDVLCRDLDKILRQRNALLRQSGGRSNDDIVSTLDVWDQRLSATGDELARVRSSLVSRVAPLLADSYDELADRSGDAQIRYEPSWAENGLLAALEAARAEDLRRGVTSVGPHRDDATLTIGAMPARTHASQGEQRTLALAMRLAAHAVVTERVGSPPLLLLDDVFSELDPTRSDALVRCLPAGQTILTTAGALPAGVAPEHVVRVCSGELHAM